MAIRIPTSEEIGERVRVARELSGISGAKLSATLSGKTDPGFVWKIETGRRKMIGVDQLFSIAVELEGKGQLIALTAYDIMDYFLFRTDWDYGVKPRPNAASSDALHEQAEGTSSMLPWVRVVA